MSPDHSRPIVSPGLRYAPKVPEQSIPIERLHTFQRRGGRLGPQLQRALQVELPRYRMPDARWDFAEVLPDHHEVVLEIGSGMGEATLAMAGAEPDTAIIAVEVLDRGIAALARGVAAAGFDNVRIHPDDAVSALANLVPANSLSGIRVWFPDPWPKARHHKRRLFQPSAVALMASRLRPGGTLHAATDVDDYAEQMVAVLGAEPTLRPVLLHGPRPTWRPVTKFEAAGAAAGRHSHDFVYVRGSD